MRLQHAFLAKYADVTAEGLCSVIGGGLSAIEIPQIPGVFSTIAFVGRVVFESGDDISQRPLTFRVCDAQGEIAAVPIPEPFSDPQKLLREPGGAVAAQIAINLVNLPIRCIGIVQFSLMSGHATLGQAELLVAQQSPGG